MTRPAHLHLSTDDFDALLEGAADADVHRHLAECADCSAQVAADRAVVSRLESLAPLQPPGNFAEQVMARVAIPDPFALHSLGTARRRLLATPRSLAAAAGIAVILAGAMAASVVWSLGNREALAAAGHWLGGEAMSWLWLAVQGGASNLFEQPWYHGVRGVVGSPIRLALISAGLSAGYLASLFALRRLMALPSPRGGAHAHA